MNGSDLKFIKNKINSLSMSTNIEIQADSLAVTVYGRRSPYASHTHYNYSGVGGHEALPGVVLLKNEKAAVALCGRKAASDVAKRRLEQIAPGLDSKYVLVVGETVFPGLLLSELVLSLQEILGESHWLTTTTLPTIVRVAFLQRKLEGWSQNGSPLWALRCVENLPEDAYEEGVKEGFREARRLGLSDDDAIHMMRSERLFDTDDRITGIANLLSRWMKIHNPDCLPD